jgi:serine carboxypeptidase-like clade 1
MRISSAVYANPYTWNNVSNVLFLEAPAGVGFSYADTPGGLIQNDTTNAIDNLNAIIQFFQGYPEYLQNDFYIAGESYAGIYVPTTAYNVYQYNKQNPSKAFNLKGILVGNGCLGTEVGTCGNDNIAAWYSLQEWRGHGLVSYQTYENAVSACGDFSKISGKCNQYFNQAASEVGHINIYYVYGPCIMNMTAPELAPIATPAQLEAAKRQIEAGHVLKKPLAHNFRPPLSDAEKAMGLHHKLGGPDACIDAGDMTAYLNRPSVIQALHVANIPWVVCSGNLSYTPTEPDERQVIYPTLIEDAKIRVLIYNGEADACGKSRCCTIRVGALM